MNEQERLEQELQEYQQKVSEITNQLYQIQIEEGNKLQNHRQQRRDVR